MTAPTTIEQHVQEIARAAMTAVRAHPGCGALADLAFTLSRFPGGRDVEAEVATHLEDAKDEAYREVWRLKRVVRDLRGRVTELEQTVADLDTGEGVTGDGGQA